jgi:hypothetical protein
LNNHLGIPPSFWSNNFLMKNIFSFIFVNFQSTFIFNGRVKILLFALLFFIIDNIAYSQCVPGQPVTVIYSSNGTESFTIPSGVTSIRVQVWGAGGRGGTQTSNGEGGGGGGGAYSESTITVTPGTTYTAFVGRGSDTEDDGQDSWLSTSSNSSNAVVLAKGGESVENNEDKGGKGGKDNDGIGTIRYEGGKGGKGKGNDGGGGGSSASPDGDGRDGEDGDKGSDGGVARAGGGNGGNGQESNSGNGDPGVEPGGGGGGATRNGSGTRTGGKGGNGQIILTYTCPSVVPPAGCSRYLDDGSVTGVVIIEFFDNCTWNAPKGLLEFEVLAIGGGGGGGNHSGGGGGSGGIVNTFVNIEQAAVFGLLSDTPFQISIGEGGLGSTDRDERGGSGEVSVFNSSNTYHTSAGGIYRITAAGGGGGGSDSGGGGNNSGNGNSGNTSSTSNETNIMVLTSYNGSGGGASHPSNNGGGGRRSGGNGNEHSGGGGGGASSTGNNGNISERGGNGGNGVQYNQFDGLRFFSAGGGGGGKDNFISLGGSTNSGGNGGVNTSGQEGQTPGSGGGGGGHSGSSQNGGIGAKGVVIVRYETARILPIEYLYFNSNYNPQARTGELSWATAKEWENSHFEIERAVDNAKEWEAIAEVAGSGFSDSEVKYNYSDMMLPVGGGNIFYRLKQYDFNGEFTYSNTKSIKVEPILGTSKWKVFPNPTTGDSFNIKILDPSTYRDESLTLRVIAPTGQFELIQKDQMQEISTQFSNYFEGKASGVYTIEIAWGANREYHKVILRR